jgi:F420-0:gamma-glutamyl ligase-like protein
LQELFLKFPGGTPTILIAICWVTISWIRTAGPQVGEFYHNTIEKTRKNPAKHKKTFLKKFLKPLDRFAAML